MSKQLSNLRPGDPVLRKIKNMRDTMQMTVTAIGELIECEPTDEEVDKASPMMRAIFKHSAKPKWRFSRETGGEVDHILNYDGKYVTGSHIEPV